MRLLSVTIAFGLAVSAAQAQSVSTSGRTQLFQSQLNVLDRRAATQYSNSVGLQPPKAIVPQLAPTVPAYTGRHGGVWLEPARAAARRHGIPEDLFARLVQQESGWNVAAISSKGAIGLAQLMPGTAQLMGVDPYDPAQNLDGGARYLAIQYRTFGNWPHALAAYNAGPGAVQRHGGIPPYAETRNYVARIWGSS
ncbi:lytic transglycosylase domain-containing protein [Salipiger sp. IMCC34102]|uniref:lytic transglycosylase domain-containing protein n=1 Tax=Salipiger sp. IMCC34102 TaxID=2510647 RepID=UPI00101CF7F6|nr:lytic transglycosylase domain-containing protein [Salipiger sp. IMCC34102]RYH03433.1 lytic transglycosylase domain-containing protein [Salipiger sp. IMCC34102]